MGTRFSPFCSNFSQLVLSSFSVCIIPDDLLQIFLYTYITRLCFQGTNQTGRPSYFLAHLHFLCLEKISQKNLGPIPEFGSSEEEKARHCVLGMWLVLQTNLLVFPSTFSSWLFRTLPRLHSFDLISCPSLQPACYYSVADTGDIYVSHQCRAQASPRDVEWVQRGEHKAENVARWTQSFLQEPFIFRGIKGQPLRQKIV